MPTKTAKPRRKWPICCGAMWVVRRRTRCRTTVRCPLLDTAVRVLVIVAIKTSRMTQVHVCGATKDYGTRMIRGPGGNILLPTLVPPSVLPPPSFLLLFILSPFFEY